MTTDCVDSMRDDGLIDVVCLIPVYCYNVCCEFCCLYVIC